MAQRDTVYMVEYWDDYVDDMVVRKCYTEAEAKRLKRSLPPVDPDYTQPCISKWDRVNGLWEEDKTY